MPIRPRHIAARVWPVIVRRIGGIYDLGPLYAVAHRTGFWFAWRQVVRLDWKMGADRA